MQSATQWTQTARSGVDNSGGSGLCCFIGLLCLVLGEPMPASGLLSSFVSEIEEVTSSNFIRTARIERAAMKGSFGDLSRFGKETSSACFRG